MLLTSSELKLFPLSPCFQKAKTLSCKQTVRRFHTLLNCQQQQLLLSYYSLSNVLPIVSMGKPKTSSVDGTPWRLTIWTVSVQQISRLYVKEDFKSWFRLGQACQTCSPQGDLHGFMHEKASRTLSFTKKQRPHPEATKLDPLSTPRMQWQRALLNPHWKIIRLTVGNGDQALTLVFRRTKQPEWGSPVPPKVPPKVPPNSTQQQCIWVPILPPGPYSLDE